MTRPSHCEPRLGMPRFSPAVIALACSAAFAAMATSEPAHAQAPVQAATTTPVSLPAQPLAQTLSALSRQFGTAIGGEGALIEGYSAPAIQGALTLSQALTQALAGSGLTYVLSGNAAITVVRPAPQSGASTLPAVTVAASAARPGDLPPAYAGGQVARGARLGTLGDVDTMDAPVNITSYTAQVIEDQAPRTVGELLGRNDASVRFAGGDGGSFDHLQIRGFAMTGGSDLTLNGLPGIVAQYRSAADFVERVELLRGAGAMIGGMSPGGAVGGSINLVTKRAGDAPLTRLTGSYLSDSRLGVQADVGRRFGEDRQWGVRVNGTVREGDTPRDWQKDGTYIGAVALDYRGPRLRASLDLIRQDMRLTAGRSNLYGVANVGVLPQAPDNTHNFDRPWSHWRSLSDTIAARAEYDLTSAVTAWAAIGQAKSPYSGQYVGNATLTNAAGDYSFSMAHGTFMMNTRAADAGLRGWFSTGSVAHRWALNASYLHRESGSGRLAAGSFSGNIHNPVLGTAPAVTGDYVTPRTSALRLPSVALSDTLSFADDRVLLTLGLRRQQVKSQNFNATTGTVSASYDASATTPFFGLVVKPWHHVSLYANRSEGLSQGATAPATALNAGDVFPPFKSRQIELGAKLDLGDFGAGAALFQIEKPSASLGADSYYRINGTQRNRGLELSAFGKPAPGLRLLSSLTLLDARMTQTPTGANEGNRAVGIPRTAANLGLEWDVPALPGLTLAGNVTYTSASWANLGNTIRVPAWQRVDIGARYRTQVGGYPLLLRAGVENALDKNYWVMDNSGGVALGMPRTLVLSATLDF